MTPALPETYWRIMRAAERRELRAHHRTLPEGPVWGNQALRVDLTGEGVSLTHIWELTDADRWSHVGPASVEGTADKGLCLTILPNPEVEEALKVEEFCLRVNLGMDAAQALERAGIGIKKLRDNFRRNEVSEDFLPLVKLKELERSRRGYASSMEERRKQADRKVAYLVEAYAQGIHPMDAIEQVGYTLGGAENALRVRGHIELARKYKKLMDQARKGSRKGGRAA